MTESGADGTQRSSRFAWLSRAYTWGSRNARIAAAFCGGIGTATVLVFNAGRDYQGLKGQVETNRVEIQALRAELSEFETALVIQKQIKGIAP